MRRSISEPIYYSERLRHRKVHHPKVAVQRWRTLCRKNQPCSASGRAQRRVTNLNWRAAKRKLQLSPELLSKVVTFTWPHVLKRKGKDALSLMTMWMCRSCKCVLPRVGKLKKHKCTPRHSGPLQACPKKQVKVLERNFLFVPNALHMAWTRSVWMGFSLRLVPLWRESLSVTLSSHDLVGYFEPVGGSLRYPQKISLRYLQKRSLGYPETHDLQVIGLQLPAIPWERRIS